MERLDNFLNDEEEDGAFDGKGAPPTNLPKITNFDTNWQVSLECQPHGWSGPVRIQHCANRVLQINFSMVGRSSILSLSEQAQTRSDRRAYSLAWPGLASKMLLCYYVAMFPNAHAESFVLPYCRRRNERPFWKVSLRYWMKNGMYHHYCLLRIWSNLRWVLPECTPGLDAN